MNTGMQLITPELVNSAQSVMSQREDAKKILFTHQTTKGHYAKHAGMKWMNTRKKHNKEISHER